METLTERQAFDAMVLFLEQVSDRTESDDIAGLLSDLLITVSNQTADPAAWSDWLACIQKVTSVAAKNPHTLNHSTHEVSA